VAEDVYEQLVGPKKNIYINSRASKAEKLFGVGGKLMRRGL
jgi:hypothetical protein